MTIVNGIKSLPMLKMEKNFIAVSDKGYSRQPYRYHSIQEIRDWLIREWTELECELDRENINPVWLRNEIADVSNILDFMYEAVLRDE